ncbi:UDP-2,3-diacylglucosamine diphosphatase LpxI [Desulfurispirillum indicum]|uniref:DUF1009 domain-containing protein n=1 Tax=Desulfurispirillum indicum (strain ATCC BAA-1389 / DSM 22839 / S5) TaxID=653733 RepID=E6W0D5_DESIS|nr:UDP-2,3-diacylglucosamine diphosphatase LpxI [Desulfurispirillum indicum]ADU66353.1 protein of unknown function DUF1009 [Desulfurispirillum indicum S5]UCZ55687.1 UDP-2,3-diacylglucosamine diphosphatase LpxI [Desulfurispirillum indicum]
MQEPSVGIICGQGDFARLAIDAYRQKGYRTFAVVLREENTMEVADKADRSMELPIEKIGRIIRFFRDHGVTDLLFAGKVHKKVVYRTIFTDITAMRLLRRFKDHRDASMMNVIMYFLEEEGFRILPQTQYLEELLAPKGVIWGKIEPDLARDIQYGYRIARMLADEEIGQTVAVLREAVVAAEALEGTDRTIVRAGELARDTTIVKVERTRQDLRFDVPVVGLETVTWAVQARCRCLAMEAEKVFFFQREESIALARKHNLVLYGI